MPEVEPQLAPVTPRAIAPDGGEVVALEALVRPIVESGVGGFVGVFGPPGSGKSTALRHLAAVMSDEIERERLVVLDGDPSRHFDVVPDKLLVAYSESSRIIRGVVAGFRLAPWTLDDVIEYVLAVYPAKAKSILDRVRVAEDAPILAGNAQLWVRVIQEMAHDESATSIRLTLARFVRSLLREDSVEHVATDYCVSALKSIGRQRQFGGSDADRSDEEELRKLFRAALSGRVSRLLRHDVVKLLIAAPHVVDCFQRGDGSDLQGAPWPSELIEAVGERVAHRPRAAGFLRSRLGTRSRRCHAMAASVLHAARIEYKPKKLYRAQLDDARLDGIDWSGVQLPRAYLRRASLRGADLRDADLRQAIVEHADLREARFRNAAMQHLGAESADLSGADLSGVRANGADFGRASLVRVMCESAVFAGATFIDADLRSARFARADINDAILVGAEIEGADFSNADLGRARLDFLALRLATFTGARFQGARLWKCDLEGMELAGADFSNADLRTAVLTGSFIPQGNFRGADLSHTGLAEINWERADLRTADLTGATFHMGSSRSGLVDSPIACEGSRTGFYTDDYFDQGYKSPEQIRKANLCGADLRGAQIMDVDFYLVDVRGAKCDADQRAHLRRCGAILEARV